MKKKQFIFSLFHFLTFSTFYFFDFFFGFFFQKKLLLFDYCFLGLS